LQNKVTSKDGTIIAFDKSGEGQVIIIVDGTLQYRAIHQKIVQLAELLGQHFTVLNYDRRGRGESTDTQPYAVEREIEDIEALINKVGRSAFLFGISSGAALAMEATIKLDEKIKKLAIYEPPYNDDKAAHQAWKQYRKQTRELLAEGRLDDAVELFMKLIGMNALLERMRQHPFWPMIKAIAPTLAYDAAVLGEDRSLPIELASKVNVPTLVMDGIASFPFLHDTTKMLAKIIPNAQHLTLEGQTHDVDPVVLAPVLVEFFIG
jgi:pimeloyl-ACP methyl ester carboxylesterase